MRDLSSHFCLMKNKYAIQTVDGLDYVSTNDAKKILGVASVKELRVLGSMTITIENGKPLWSVKWIINRAKHRRPTDSFHPDMEWIYAYEEHREVSDSRPRKKLAVPRSPGDNSLTTSARLKELRKLMPPPDEVPGRDIKWDAVETAVGVEYPKSYKDFIDVYGALQWFDWLQPLVPFEDMSATQFAEFLEGVFKDNFGEDVVDTNGELVLAPKFGISGGWLPFMTGSDGDAYAWITDGPSEEWNVIRALNRRVMVVPPISITEMFVRWLKNEPPMQELWGSVDEFRKHSPNRISMLR